MPTSAPSGPFSRQSAQFVESLPGRAWGGLQSVGRSLGGVLNSLGGVGNYLSSEQAAKDYTNLLRGRLPNKPTLNGIQTGKYGNSDWQIPGWTPPGSAPTVNGLDRGGNIDRRQSDQYRAAMGQQVPTYPSFPQTPQGQFERYFSSGSPEMERYFGAASRGAGAPKSLEEMNALASQRSAPTSAPLSAYYRAQSAAGRGNMDEIVDAMGYKGTPMEQWAKANPMLAQREYSKKFPGGRSASPFPSGSVANLNVPVSTAFANQPFVQGAGTRQEPSTMNPAFTSQDLLRGANPFGMPALTGQQPSGAAQGMDTSQLYGKGAPNLAAFTLPGGAMTQGTQVSAPFQQAANAAFQRTNPMNFGVDEQAAAVGDTSLQGRLKNFFAGVGAR